MALLIVFVALAAVVVETSASCSLMLGMTGSIMSQCKEVEGCGVSNEHFRRIMAMDLTLLDEGLEAEENKKSWAWISCLYNQAGLVNNEGNFNQDGFDMYINMMWKDDENKPKATEIIKSGAKEASAEGKTNAEKMITFYKKMVEKELPMPKMMIEKRAMMDGVKKCLESYPVTVEDMSSVFQQQHPMTDMQGGFGACVTAEAKSEGDEICACYIPKVIDLIQDKSRKQHVMDGYNKCKDSMENFKERYHKVDEFPNFKHHFMYMYDCMPKEIEELSYDDFCPLH